ncbi:MAG: alpha/beta hydrolase [Chloroflexota bacterium]|nr:alpha/beta hydrolase [Chloroflexota bacterium]
MGDGLAEGPDGRGTLRYDPILRVPGPPGRLNPSADEFAERLARVTCPTLFAVGATSFHADVPEQVATVNPQARLVRVPQAGLWAPLDKPSRFLDVVGHFLDGAV